MLPLAQIMLLAQEAAAADPSAESGFSIVEWITGIEGRLILATLLGGFGLWWMLPGSTRRVKTIGSVLAVVAGALFFSVLPISGVQFEAVLFCIFAGLTLASGAATITSRSPVYCAIWFALMLLGVGGLFLLNGAQFLGVATIAVYAGAIVVTFLFVLMLAQPEGHSFYDRISWGKVPSLFSCLAGVGFAALMIWAVSTTPLDQLGGVASTTESKQILNANHVAHLGGQLFTRHLIAVQAAASLLLAALVGAVAMASHGTARKLEERRRAAEELAESVGTQGGAA
ncbi:MAG: NADH-quinone oxidoreductase subunit J [Planctomycetota bacterium]